MNATSFVAPVPALSEAPTVVPEGSAVSWTAILLGTVTAVATTVVLGLLGAGAGLASVSVWSRVGVSAISAGAAGAIWLIVIQWVAAGLGGYLAGRLRTRWSRTHEHEVFFRDTAHGLATWALSLLIVSLLVVASVAAGLSVGARAAMMLGLDAASTRHDEPSVITGYDLDRLFRSENPSGGSQSDARSEASRLLGQGLAAGTVPDDDRRYLAQLIASHTGIAPASAESRVDAAIGQLQTASRKARDDAEAARKAAAEAALLGVLALLIGAFIAASSAVLGGHERDQHP
jgi:hypothetical protein